MQVIRCENGEVRPVRCSREVRVREMTDVFIIQSPTPDTVRGASRRFASQDGASWTAGELLATQPASRSQIADAKQSPFFAHSCGARRSTNLPMSDQFGLSAFHQERVTLMRDIHWSTFEFVYG